MPGGLETEHPGTYSTSTNGGTHAIGSTTESMRCSNARGHRYGVFASFVVVGTGGIDESVLLKNGASTKTAPMHVSAERARACPTPGMISPDAFIMGGRFKISAASNGISPRGAPALEVIRANQRMDETGWTNKRTLPSVLDQGISGSVVQTWLLGPGVKSVGWHPGNRRGPTCLEERLAFLGQPPWLR